MTKVAFSLRKILPIQLRRLAIAVGMQQDLLMNLASITARWLGKTAISSFQGRPVESFMEMEIIGRIVFVLIIL